MAVPPFVMVARALPITGPPRKPRTVAKQQARCQWRFRLLRSVTPRRMTRNLPVFAQGRPASDSDGAVRRVSILTPVRKRQ